MNRKITWKTLQESTVKAFINLRLIVFSFFIFVGWNIFSYENA